MRRFNRRLCVVETYFGAAAHSSEQWSRCVFDVTASRGAGDRCDGSVSDLKDVSAQTKEPQQINTLLCCRAASHRGECQL